MKADKIYLDLTNVIKDKIFARMSAEYMHRIRQLEKEILDQVNLQAQRVAQEMQHEIEVIRKEKNNN